MSAWALSPEHDLMAVAGGPPAWLTWGLARPAGLRTHQSDPADWYVALVDTRTKVEIARLLGPRWICTVVAFSPDGALVVAGSTDHRVYVWDLRSRRLLYKPRVPEVPTALSWAGSGRVVVRCSDRSVRMFDVLPSPPSEVKVHARHADPPEG